MQAHYQEELGFYAGHIRAVLSKIRGRPSLDEIRSRPSLDDVGALVELLVRSSKSLGTIRNYVSAIRSFLHDRGVPDSAGFLASPGWGVMMKGLTNTIRQTEDRRSALSFEELQLLVGFCNSDRAYLSTKIGLIFGFMGYLRLSNLAPESASSFDSAWHTSWADVHVSGAGIMIDLKWSKTMQAVKGVTPIPLPALDNELVCPVRAWEEYVGHLSHIEPSRLVPLLLSTDASRGEVISAARFRGMFHRVCKAAGLGHRGLTPHSLRRGGASNSFKSGVPLHHIKAHGTWRSATVERYLLQTPRFDAPVAMGFKQTT